MTKTQMMVTMWVYGLPSVCVCCDQRNRSFSLSEVRLAYPSTRVEVGGNFFFQQCLTLTHHFLSCHVNWPQKCAILPLKRVWRCTRRKLMLEELKKHYRNFHFEVWRDKNHKSSFTGGGDATIIERGSTTRGCFLVQKKLNWSEVWTFSMLRPGAAQLQASMVLLAATSLSEVLQNGENIDTISMLYIQL